MLPESCPLRTVTHRRACRRPMELRASAPIAPDNRQRQGGPESGRGKDPDAAMARLVFFLAAAWMSRNFGGAGNQALSPPVHDIPSRRNECEHRAHASARVIPREPIRYVQRGNAPAIEGYTVAGCAGRFPPVGCRRAFPCRLFCCSSPWARAPSASANVRRRLPR